MTSIDYHIRRGIANIKNQLKEDEMGEQLRIPYPDPLTGSKEQSPAQLAGRITRLRVMRGTKGYARI